MYITAALQTPPLKPSSQSVRRPHHRERDLCPPSGADVSRTIPKQDH